MKKRFSPTMIGAFVVGAVVLVVIAVIVFGSGRLFRQTRDFILYFDNSVNGLRIGAPVKIKGVEIGSVKGAATREKGGVGDRPAAVPVTGRGARPAMAQSGKNEKRWPIFSRLVMR